MGDGRGRLVTDHPAVFEKSPDEVDVLADSHHLVEHQVLQRIPADQEGGRRQVPQYCARRDQLRTGAHVERRPATFIPGEQGLGIRAGPDPGCDADHPRVVEMSDERTEPPRRDRAVGIDERDDRRTGHGKSGVAGSGGSLVRRVPDQRRPVRAGHLCDRCRRRPVVHDDDAHQGCGCRQCRQAGVE